MNIYVNPGSFLFIQTLTAVGLILVPPASSSSIMIIPLCHIMTRDALRFSHIIPIFSETVPYNQENVACWFRHTGGAPSSGDSKNFNHTHLCQLLHQVIIMISNIIKVVTTDAQGWCSLPPLCWMWLSPLSCLSTSSSCLITCKWIYLATCLTKLLTCKSSSAIP